MRLRIGVFLWLLSWIPYGLILGVSGTAYTLCWAFEIAIGIIGLAIAGTELADVIKASGWKRTPGIALHVLVHGTTP